MSALLRFMPKHLLDLLMTRGGVMVVIGFVVMLPTSLAMSQGNPTPEQLVGSMRDGMGTLGFFYAMLASYSLIGGDVRHGFYRFLFAKPVSPVAYYVMSYASVTVVWMLGMLATVGLWAVLMTPTWPGWPAMGDYFVDYLLVSSLILVFSRASSADWIFGPVVLGLAAALRSRFPAEESAVGRVLNWFLPPTDTGRLFPLDGGVNWEPLLIQLAYAGLLLGLAMVIVRKVPMGSAR